ncbi:MULTISPECIES: hypothetical protein [Streptosporangium]|uniref:SAM-dependent methyltransferase n=1 Tax=Streptosporangium brasiliense TaxID=47480 RepID=A0ABT9QXJ9_9ACTN|nr:hypothetical protein [Streptosporangium brasiliense]MDP9861259.1 hypothetical protein [Streptosporangium brasiliense]
MAVVIAVLHAEDVALEFVSVLRRHADRDIRVIVGQSGAGVTLPAGLSPRERLRLLAPLVEPGGNTAALPSPEEVAGWLDGPPAEVWTHSPADHRIRRARFGWTVSCAVPGLTVTYSVGDNPFLQTVPGEVAALTGAEADIKIDFINRHAGELLRSRVADRLVTTDRVPVVERFFAADVTQANRLYALISSLGDDAAVADDPWEFGRSAYEADRLDATAAWVTRWCSPDDGPIVEVGACEGELTRRLAGKGYAVHATEPNAGFRARLAGRMRTGTGSGTGVEAGAGSPDTAGAVPGVAGWPGAEVSPDSLEDLAARRDRPAAAYLLIEMLYYDQDLALLDALPTDRVLIALESGRLNDLVWPWLRGQSVWRVAERLELAPPTLESVCDGLAYLRKRGSRGLVLTRAGAAG